MRIQLFFTLGTGICHAKPWGNQPDSWTPEIPPVKHMESESAKAMKPLIRKLTAPVASRNLCKETGDEVLKQNNLLNELVQAFYSDSPEQPVEADVLGDCENWSDASEDASIPIEGHLQLLRDKLDAFVHIQEDARKKASELQAVIIVAASEIEELVKYLARAEKDMNWFVTT